MLFQTRPFFRKKLKLNIKKPDSTFKLSNSSFKNSKKNKLSPHKFKKLNRGKLLTQITPSLAISRFWAPMQFKFDEFGSVVAIMAQNYLGIVASIPGVSGYWFNSNLSLVVKYSHSILSMYALQNPINNLLCYIYNKSKIYGSRSAIVSSFQPSGLLLVRLKGKTTLLHQTTSIMGLPLNRGNKTTGVVSRVRGIAKNPVDHPNGGRANTKGSFKTPWGSYAKANK